MDSRLEVADLSATRRSGQERALCSQTTRRRSSRRRAAPREPAHLLALRGQDRVLEYALGHDERFGIWGGCPSASGASSSGELPETTDARAVRSLGEERPPPVGGGQDSSSDQAQQFATCSMITSWTRRPGRRGPWPKLSGRR